VREKTQSGDRNQLFEDDGFVSLAICTKTIPQKARHKPYLIPIPHTLFKEGTIDICAFVADDTDPAHIQALKQTVSTVIPLAKLRANYKQHESKRTLCGQYDLFVADKRILTMLPGLLGKVFFRTKKLPVPINIIPEKSIKGIENATNSAHLFVPHGVLSNLRIGRVNFEVDHIVDNIMVALSYMMNKENNPFVEWENIQAVYIKTTDSVSLPLYNSLPVAGVISNSDKQPVIQKGGTKRKSEEIEANDGAKQNNANEENNAVQHNNVQKKNTNVESETNSSGKEYTQRKKGIKTSNTKQK
jgi:ribosome biogenesis protein UTP30